MAFGTLGTPDETYSEMDDLLVDGGSMTYMSDGLGGTASISDGAGVRSYINGTGGLGTGIYGDVAHRYRTVCCLARILSVSAKAQIIDTDVSGANRNVQFYLTATGELECIWLSNEEPGTETITTVGTYDNSTPTIFCYTLDVGTVGSTSDHAMKIFAAPLFGAIEEITLVQSDDLQYWTSIATATFGAAPGGSQPMPNGSWIGQVRSWYGASSTKFADLSAFQQIQLEYQTLSNSSNGQGNSVWNQAGHNKIGRIS